MILFKYVIDIPTKDIKEGTTTASLPIYETESIIPLGSMLNLI